jgi:antitoxin ParD1/3/4
MSINLRPDIEQFLREKVEMGQFESIEEAANELLGWVSEDEKLTDEDIAELRREVQLGIDQADRGEFVEFTAEQIIAEKKAAARKQKAG